MAETTTPYRRETAQICSIEEILSGEYVVREGWNSNYVNTGSRRLSRVNIMGVVVEKQDMYSFMLDDGTGTIPVTDFERRDETANLGVGKPVLVIGKPRKTNEQLFVACEIINMKQLERQPMWLTLRKKLLQSADFTPSSSESQQSEDSVSEEKDDSAGGSSVKEEEKTGPVLESSGQNAPIGDDVIAFLKEKDDGSGCDIDEIVKHLGASAEDTVHTLITMGEIYEIRPGKIKVLE